MENKLEVFNRKFRILFPSFLYFLGILELFNGCFGIYYSPIRIAAGLSICIFLLNLLDLIPNFFIKAFEVWCNSLIESLLK